MARLLLIESEPRFRFLLLSSFSRRTGAHFAQTALAANTAAGHGALRPGSLWLSIDPFAIDERDESFDCGEDRFATTGLVDGRMIFVAYTMRGDRIRIISARGAEPHEQRRYHKENR